MNHSEKPSIILVDDDDLVRDSATRLLQEVGFDVVSFADGHDALAWLMTKPVDAVLSDIKMPKITGIELLVKIHANDPETPVILMTGFAELEVAVAAIHEGAFDFITKPYNPTQLIHILEKAVDFKRLRQLEKNYQADLEVTVELRTCELGNALRKVECMSREIIERLASAAELRDDDTGQHNNRIGQYAAAIARALQAPNGFIETLTLASAMHDVGKIGIPDSILLKPGALTAEEFDIVKSHASIGKDLLSGSSHSLLQMAASIAYTHHERWDGSGYPEGLKGDEIPLEGRIVMLADQYDALRNKRVYKPALDHATTCEIIIEGDGRTLPEHFDPQVLQAFIQVSSELEVVFSRLSQNGI